MKVILIIHNSILILVLSCPIFLERNYRYAKNDNESLVMMIPII